MTKKPIDRLYGLPFRFIGVAFLLLSLSACQEFIHNSFDTFTGKIVDAEGKPVANLEFSVTQELDFAMAGPVPKSVIYKVQTDEKGAFSFVLPSRSDDAFNNYYFLWLSAPLLFQTEGFGEPVRERFLSVPGVARATGGVRDLGTLKIVRE